MSLPKDEDITFDLSSEALGRKKHKTNNKTSVHTAVAVHSRRHRRRRRRRRKRSYVSGAVARDEQPVC